MGGFLRCENGGSACIYLVCGGFGSRARTVYISGYLTNKDKKQIFLQNPLTKFSFIGIIRISSLLYLLFELIIKYLQPD